MTSYSHVVVRIQKMYITLTSCLCIHRPEDHDVHDGGFNLESKLIPTQHIIVPVVLHTVAKLVNGYCTTYSTNWLLISAKSKAIFVTAQCIYNLLLQ